MLTTQCMPQDHRFYQSAQFIFYYGANIAHQAEYIEGF